MLTNGGDPEGLFRGAFMESGSPVPVGDITHGQKDYDALVSATGCSSAVDTLQCLREAPFETLMDAVNQSPGIFSPRVRSAGLLVLTMLTVVRVIQSLDLAWLPRADGVFLPDDLQALVSQGSVANIPFVTGVSPEPLRNSALYSVSCC